MVRHRLLGSVNLEPDSLTVSHTSIFPQTKKGKASRNGAGRGAPETERSSNSAAYPAACPEKTFGLAAPFSLAPRGAHRALTPHPTSEVDIITH